MRLYDCVLLYVRVCQSRQLLQRACYYFSRCCVPNRPFLANCREAQIFANFCHLLTESTWTACCQSEDSLSLMHVLVGAHCSQCLNISKKCEDDCHKPGSHGMCLIKIIQCPLINRCYGEKRLEVITSLLLITELAILTSVHVKSFANDMFSNHSTV
jgi:hypothetical protein